MQILIVVFFPKYNVSTRVGSDKVGVRLQRGQVTRLFVSAVCRAVLLVTRAPGQRGQGADLEASGAFSAGLG